MRIRKLDIDNTGNYKRGFSSWVIRYKSIRGYKVRKIRRLSKEEARRLERAAAREARREKRVPRTTTAMVKPADAGKTKTFQTKRSRVHVVKFLREADWIVIGICLFAIFSVVFMYNALRGNRANAQSAPEIGENISLISSLQSGSVDDIEARVEQLNSLDVAETEVDGDPRARYMALMSDAVVVGDSLTEGLTVYGWLSDRQVFSEIGASIVSGESMFTQAAALHPKNAFFAFGMNDMGNFNGDEKAFVERYNELLDGFIKESPNTKLYICSISVPTEDAIAGNSAIGNYEKFNEALKKMANDRKIAFVDSTDILIEHPEFYAGDGIHVSSDYYPYWLDNMVRAISKYGLR